MLSFSFSANADLFQGSVVNITGLLGFEASCPACSGVGEEVPGLGCSDRCPQCSAPEGSSCVAVFESDAKTAHKMLEQLATFDADLGVLSLRLNGTLRVGEPLEFILAVRNPFVSQERGRECGPGDSQGDIAAGTCLTILAGPVQLCDSKAPPDVPIACRGDMGAFIDASTKAVDPLGNALLDPCPAYPPSLQGIPTLIEGGVALGSYTLLMQLTNWLGAVGYGRYTFQKKKGQQPSGPRNNEYTKPLLQIEGEDTRVMTADQPLQLVARGRAATCSLLDPSVEGVAVLTYAWKVECLSGPCSRVPPLASLSTRGVASFGLDIPGDKLPPGVLLEFTITASQASIERTNTATVQVRTQVRPLAALIAGVSPRGLVSITADLVLHSSRSFDPEADVTGLAPPPPPPLWVPGKLRPMSAKERAPPKGILSVWSCRRQVAACGERATGGWCLGAATKACDLGGAPTNLAELTIPKAGLVVGVVYEVTLTSTRNAEALFNASLVFPASSPSSFSNPSSSSVSFAVVEGAKNIPVYITVCDPSKVGTIFQCESSMPFPRLSADRPLVLQAAVDPSWERTLRPVVVWESLGEVDSELLTPGPQIRTSTTAPLLIFAAGLLTSCYSGPQIRTSTTAPLLIFAAGLLTPGHTLRLRVTITDSAGSSG
ncbi:hypothetical protein T484DRAFT_1761735 [Baffinella frigidus]|nr:hypothetical protein T484DRAFT_1761735 [Cryptophyta sp. CCMP2293]